MGPIAKEIEAHYLQGGESERLSNEWGELERLRTQGILARHLPSSPAVIVDVGGGDGTLLIEILRTHPLLRGRVLDLPPAAAAAADKLAASDVADRASAVAGNFFDSLPGGANAYVLSDVIRDWDNSNAVKVMDACARAAGHGSSVIVIEELRGADTAHALTLAVVTGGRERSADQLTALARACGLSLRSTAQVSGRRTALEFIVT